MPTRSLKPGLSQSKRYNRCSWMAQSLFTRLLMHVDDFARYDADGELLASILFPYGDPKGERILPAKISALLMELERADMLLTYESQGSKYLVLKRWTDRVRASYSRCPPPPAGTCWQMSASADDKPTLPTLAATNPTGRQVSSLENQEKSPPPTTTTTTTTASTPTSSTEREKGASPAGDPVAASRTQAGALLAKIKKLEANKASLSDLERADLRKKRRDLAELQDKQSRGDFSPLKEKIP